MTFEQWFADMQDRYDASYSGYEDLLKECWETAQKAETTSDKEFLKGVLDYIEETEITLEAEFGGGEKPEMPAIYDDVLIRLKANTQQQETTNEQP